METTLLQRVRSRQFLRTRRRIAHLLDGRYASLARGRSMEFEDLRDYLPGDEVADIDWSATARTGSPLVRRWVDERRHRMLFVVDSGRNLAAGAEAAASKRDLAITAVGVLGSLALRHGDEVGLVLGDSSGSQRTPFRTSERALEAVLQRIDRAARADGEPSDMVALLHHVGTTVRERTVLVIVADEIPWTDALERVLRRLAAQHEIVWIELADVDLTASRSRTRRVRDVADGWEVPEGLRADRRLAAEYRAHQRRRRAAMEATFGRLAISQVRIGAADDTVPVLLHMLEERAHAQR